MDPNNEIGYILRDERSRAGLTGRQLERKIGRNQSYISKIESGALRPNEDYIRALAQALNLSDERFAEIIALFKLYEIEHQPLPNRATALGMRQKHIRELEQSSRFVRCFSLNVVPGLLQTPDYMRSIFIGAKMMFNKISEKDIDRGIDERAMRQDMLRDSQNTFVFLLSESTINHRVAPAHVMHQQISALLSMAERGRDKTVGAKIEIKCIPFTAEYKLAPASGFTTYDKNIIILDTLDGFFTLRHPTDVRRYISVFEEWEKLAMHHSQFVTLLKKKRSHYSGRLNPIGPEKKKN